MFGLDLFETLSLSSWLEINIVIEKAFKKAIRFQIKATMVRPEVLPNPISL